MSKNTLRFRCEFRALKIGFLAIAFALPLLIVPGFAQTEQINSWIGEDGDYSDAANWETGAVPERDEAAAFAPQGPITVTLGEDATVGSLMVNGVADGDGNPQVNFDLAGYRLMVGSDETPSNNSLPAFYLQSFPDTGSRTVMIKNGGVVVSGVVTLSNMPNDEFSLVIVGQGGELRSAGGSIGNVGRGKVSITDGGKWFTEGVIYLGRTGLSAEGVVQLKGKDSEWNALGESGTTRQLAGIGAAGAGTLEITEGASMHAYVVQLAGHQSHMETPGGDGRGTVLVKDQGSSLQCAYLYVGGGKNRVMDAKTTAGGAGSVTVADHGTVEVGQLQVFPFSTLSFEGGTISVTGFFEEKTMALSVFEPGSILGYRLAKPGLPAPFTVTDLTIDQVKLDIVLGEEFVASPGQVFSLVRYGGQLTGTFAGLANGATLTAGSYTLAIDYGTPAERTITLKVVSGR